MPALIGKPSPVSESERLTPVNITDSEAEQQSSDRHKSECQDLITFLLTHECPVGLTKKEIRNLKNKAATHKWDTASKQGRI